MGLNRNSESGGESPKTALFATGTPAELRELGVNLGDKPSCAVPDPQNGIMGCPHAANCSKLFGQDRFGGFGPKSAAKGTAGQGPEYVPYYVETPEGDAKEDFIRCSAFMAGLYGRMLAMNDPTEPSGEVIQILGVAGQTKIRTFLLLPEEPKSKTNTRMAEEVEQVFVVPKHPRPKDVDRRGTLRQSAAMREAAEKHKFERVTGHSSAEEAEVTHVFAEEGPTPVVSKPVQRKNAGS